MFGNQMKSPTGLDENIDTIVDPPISSTVGMHSPDTYLASIASRQLSSKLSDTISVLDFGADSTGETVSTAAIQATVNSGIKSLYFPPGDYSISYVIDVAYGDGREESEMLAQKRDKHKEKTQALDKIRFGKNKWAKPR